MADPVRSMTEALARFHQVLTSTKVPARRQTYLLMWVKRFDAFRTRVLKRSFRTCGEDDIVAFLRQERRSTSRPDWQWKQAAEALVLFLRHVIGRSDVEGRQVFVGLDGDVSPVVEELGPPRVDQSAPEWHQAVQRELRVHHYALRTEEAYLDWLKRYVQYHGGRDPRQMGTREVKAYLEHLAIDRHVAPSTQNQAFSALLFAYTKG